MADVTIEALGFINWFYNATSRCGPFWVTPLIGYVFYTDGEIDLKYNKTIDGGVTWAGPTNIRAGSVIKVDCKADWQTRGDTGTKIHVVYLDYLSDDARYVYLDTATDTIGGDIQVEACLGTGVIYGANQDWEHHQVSITKTRGGNLAIALRYQDDAPTVFDSFYTSPDGITWTARADVFEGVISDRLLLFPANLADPNDLQAVYWDASATEITLKTFDDDGNSWAETIISGGMTPHNNFFGMDGQVRLSDGHVIFAAWTEWAEATSDLKVWDITDAGTITAKTNIITDTDEYQQCSVFINPVNDDIYVAYLGGTQAANLTAALYQKSKDGGTTWDGETALQADAEDDMRWISAGAMKAAWGGKFQPFWFDHDDKDLFTNTDNSISITGYHPRPSGMKVGTSQIY